MALEDADEYPGDIVEGMKELGLFGCVISEEHGGLGLPVTTYVRIVERICETWMSLSGVFNTHLLMAWIVQTFGTAEQKAAWLPKFASGEMRGGLALTEPGCGTDLQAIRTRAVRDGNRLRGERDQDLDHQRLLRGLRGPAGQDRSCGRTASQGHQSLPRAKGRGIHGKPQAPQARLPGRRHGGTRLRRFQDS